MRWFFALWLAVPAVCAAHPFEIEDLLHLESYGQVAIASQARLVLIERRAAYDAAADYSYGYFVRRLLTRIEVVDLDRPRRPRPLFHQQSGAGYWMGGLSPNGKRLAVYRLRDRTLALGVVDLGTRAVRWFPIHPDLPIAAPRPIWIDNDHIVSVAMDGTALPEILANANAQQSDLPLLWATAARGKTVTSTRVTTAQGSQSGTGARRLVEIDVRNGRLTERFAGSIVDAALSSDGKRLAVMTAGRLAPPPTESLSPAFVLRVHQVRLIERRTGRVEQVVDDVLPGVLLWSSSGDLLVLQRGLSPRWTDSRFMSLGRHGVRQLGPTTASPVVTADQTSIVVQASWIGSRVAASVVSPNGPRWMTLSPHAAHPLDLAPSATLIGADTGSLQFRHDASVITLRADRHETAKVSHVLTTGLSLQDPSSTGYRALVYPASLVPLLTTREDGGATLRSPHGDVLATFADRHEDVLATAPHTTVTMTTDAHGTSRLRLYGAEPPREIDRINDHLGDVTLSRSVPLSVRMTDGSTRRHWLFLPDRPSRVPLVVLPYPGQILGDAPPASASPAAMIIPNNINLLVGHGYGVLVPSIETGPVGNPGRDLVASIDAAADAAIATGRIDPDRLAILGHSFGGYAALVTATGSRRYRAVIAASGPYDLAAVHDSMAGPDRIRLLRGLPFDHAAGWAEGGQGNMGTSPARNPALYANASPIFSAEHTKVPVLLVHGDMDFVGIDQAEHAFMALAREKADVTLLRYWGEGHVLSSPANIRDYWTQVFAFLDKHLRITDPAHPPTPEPMPRN